MYRASKSIINSDLKTLFRISLPLMFFLSCEALTSFCEQMLLSYHSMNSVYISLNANYLVAISQFPCIAVGTMVQVFIGLYHGSSEYTLSSSKCEISAASKPRNAQILILSLNEYINRIGPCVWQLI